MNIGEAEKQEDLLEESSAFETMEDAFSEAEKKLVDFVSKNIERMKAHLIQDVNPNITKVNEAMIEYPSILFALNSLYNRVRFDADRAQAEFDAFYSQAYMAVKEEFNNKNVDKKAWYSVKELEYTTNTKYGNKIAQLRAKLAMAEGRKSFVRRLLDGWGSYQFMLGQLSKNLNAEAYANKIDYYGANHTPMGAGEY